MKGANINAAATGLMQGIQYMDERNRRAKQDEREARRDELYEKDYALRAEAQGIRLKKEQNELADYEADAPLREGERESKLKAIADQQEQEATMDRLAEAMARDDMTGSLDGRISFFNELGQEFGTQVKAGARDPKTGKVSVTFVGPDGKEQTGEYASIDELDDDILTMANKEYRTKALAARQSAKTDSAKEDREHGRKKELKQMEIESAERIARMNNTTKQAISDAKAAIMESRGRGVIESQADRRVQTINLLKTMKDDPSLKFHTNPDGKPDLKRPKSFDDQYNEVYSLLYGNDAAPAVAPAAPANPAAAGVKPAKPAAPKTPTPVIDFSKYRMQ
ncbi:MAG: hypothetical protein AB7E72_16195 [Lysobacterales bacterium]